MVTQPQRPSGSRGGQQPVGAHAPQRTKAPLLSSRRPAFGAVVQAADLRDRHDLPHLWRLDRPWFWGGLLQREMSSGGVVVVQVPTEDSAKRGLADDDHMIQALAADRADDPLDVGPLPGRPRCRQHFLDAEILDLLGEVVTEDAVAISQQIAWRGIPRKGLTELLRGLLRRGVSRDAEVEDPAALVGQHQEYVQDLEPDGRHGEEVDRDHGLEVILEEGAPGLRGRPPVAHQVFAHAGLADVDAELEQFPVNARSAPERILPAHLADQIPNFP